MVWCIGGVILAFKARYRRITIIDYIIKSIQSIKKDRPVLIAFDGVDTSGKTTLADQVYQSMLEQGLFSLVRVQIDKFHNPRDIRIQKGELSPEGFFYDSFDYHAILENVIKPVKNARGNIAPGIFDYRDESDIEAEKIPVTADTVVLFDGIFLNRDELYSFWDLSVFLDVSFDIVLKRALIRDVQLLGGEDNVRQRYENRYVPGQKIYLESCHPPQRAHIVIDNNDYNNPKITKKYKDSR